MGIRGDRQQASSFFFCFQSHYAVATLDKEFRCLFWYRCDT